MFQVEKMLYVIYILKVCFRNKQKLGLVNMSKMVI